MSQEIESDLKRPIGIYILAGLFMVAPVGNILVSFAGSGVENWYYPAQFLELSGTIAWMDWLWLGGVFLSGITLMIRHKSAWMVAVSALLLILAMNTHRAFTIDESVLNPEFVRVQILISILVTFSVLIIAFYARYPYLDRRQQWVFPTADRYDVRTPVTVRTASNLPGWTESISSSGIRIRLTQPNEALKSQKNIEFTFDEKPDWRVIRAEVVECDGEVLRLAYKRFGWSSRLKIEAWLRSKKS